VKSLLLKYFEIRIKPDLKKESHFTSLSSDKKILKSFRVGNLFPIKVL